MMSKKAKDEWERKQAEEAEKLRKQNEVCNFPWMPSLIFRVIYYLNKNNWISQSLVFGSIIMNFRHFEISVVLTVDDITCPSS